MGVPINIITRIPLVTAPLPPHCKKYLHGGPIKSARGLPIVVTATALPITVTDTGHPVTEATETPIAFTVTEPLYQ